MALLNETLAWGVLRLPQIARFFAQGFEPRHWEAAPSPDTHSAWWILGHMAHSLDAMLPEVRRSFPAAWAEAFAAGRPKEESGRATWPSPAELFAAMDATAAAVAAWIAELGDTELTAEAKGPFGPCRQMERLQFLEIHLAYHAGQIGLIRRLQGLPGVV